MVKNLTERIVYKGWKELKLITFDYLNKKGKWISDKKEIYVRGDAATILLYNLERRTVLLTKQFRMPTYMNGNNDGMLIETCAGMLDGRLPEACIIKEAEEEMGLKLINVQKVFEGYSSPGAITEILHFFIGEYNLQMKVSDGGGLEEENEEIEILELPFDDFYNMIHTHEIKDIKTIALALYLKANTFFHPS